MEKANYNGVLVEYTGVSVFKELNDIIVNDSGMVLLHTKDKDILMSVHETKFSVYGYRVDYERYTTDIDIDKTDDMLIIDLIVIILKWLKSMNKIPDLL